MRLAVDVGSVRVGVARSDPDGILAVPEATLGRDDTTGRRIVALIEEYSASRVYVGLPLTLAGEEGIAARSAREFAEDLAVVVPCEVRLVDERLSTVEAQRALRDAGRSTRDSRSVIDQAAAVLVLEHALSVERATGNPAGFAVTVRGGVEGEARS
ncbi:MAG: Holliday junction resolvase RuvX [Candidatus Nanopelagicales bacterium]